MPCCCGTGNPWPTRQAPSPLVALAAREMRTRLAISLLCRRLQARPLSVDEAADVWTSAAWQPKLMLALMTAHGFETLPLAMPLRNVVMAITVAARAGELALAVDLTAAAAQVDPTLAQQAWSKFGAPYLPHQDLPLMRRGMAQTARSLERYNASQATAQGAYHRGYNLAVAATRAFMEFCPKASALLQLTFVARHRRAIAFDMDTPDAALFGVWRRTSLHTPVFDYFHIHGVHYTFEQLCRGRAHGRIIEDQGGLRIAYTMAKTSTGAGVELTRTVVVRDKPLRTLFPLKTGHGWEHTEPSAHHALLVHVEHLLAQLPSRADEGTASLIRAVGELHWWLAQATFFKRGSAAIGEIFCEALLRQFGLEVSAWCGHVAADVIALDTPDAATFAAAYPTLFVQPPARVDHAAHA